MLNYQLCHGAGNLHIVLVCFYSKLLVRDLKQSSVHLKELQINIRFVVGETGFV